MNCQMTSNEDVSVVKAPSSLPCPPTNVQNNDNSAEEHHDLKLQKDVRFQLSQSNRRRKIANMKTALIFNPSSASSVCFIGCILFAIFFQNDFESSFLSKMNGLFQSSNLEFPTHNSILVDAFGWTMQSSRALIASRRCCNQGNHDRTILYGFGPLLLNGLVGNDSSLIKRRAHCYSRSIFPGERKSFVASRSTVSSDTETEQAQSQDSMKVKVQVNGDSPLNGSHSLPTNGHSKSEADENNHTINGSVNGNNNSIKLEETNGINGSHESNGDDIPMPTENGGYSHTSASKAKISAANKGKTPWNKGKERSDEVKQRIAEGVRRKNRERFLAKLAAEGITEEEYEQRKKEERRRKDAERRARKTANGGYTPTEETKKKISKILKEKYASGEIKRAPRAENAIRRGFKHSEETKQKIRESLRKKWAEDTEYREMMTNKTIANPAINNEAVRKRIAETLKKKWEDPEFRAKMMEKFSKRQTSGTRGETHRKKISEAMKRKWMDDEYRKRATAGMAKGRESVAKAVRPVKPKMPKKRLATVTAVTKATPVRKAKGTTTGTKKKKKTTKKKKVDAGDVMAVKPLSPLSQASEKSSSKASSSAKDEAEQEGDGSISRLREERRDLYDLLYGDDDEDDDGDIFSSKPLVNGATRGPAMKTSKGRPAADPSPRANPVTGGGGAMSPFLFGDDEDLDDFDPYGLDDV